MAGQPNILLLMSDQHRADVLGCEGDPVVATPNLDALAATGTRYRSTYCQAPLCMPARASLMTERYVRDHGVYENRWDVPLQMPTFLHSLQDVGYHTACIGKMHVWVHGRRDEPGDWVRDTRSQRERMIAYGFDEPIETVGKLASVIIGSEYGDYLAERGVLDEYRAWMARRRYGGEDTLPNWFTGSVPLDPDDYIDAWHGRRAARWLSERAGDRPWFLWVGFPGPHDPWDAPAAEVDRYRDASMPMPGTLRRPDIPDSGPLHDFLSYWLWEHSDSETLTDEQVAEVRRHYYADVTVIDRAVGEIREALARSGQDENTWIIYTSDHGEMLGEHRMLMKMVFYEPAVRVPLIVYPPGGSKGEVVDDLTEHLDLTATIRAIAGAGAPDDAGFEGRSLLYDGRLRGAGRDAVYSENYGMAMVRTDRHKLVFHEDTLTPGQLFDLIEDPHEDRNLVDDPGYAAVLARLMDERVRPFLRDGRAKPGPGLFERAA